MSAAATERDPGETAGRAESGLAPGGAPFAPPPAPHAAPAAESIRALATDPSRGLSAAEARARLARAGPNALPSPAATPALVIFARQFMSPLIYVLIAAALLSVVIGEAKDALFIGAVLLLNATIGAVQERGAERGAHALRRLLQARARVLRDGVEADVAAEDVVPGDIVLLESGNRVPADLRLLATNGLEADESLLTGESANAEKDAACAVAPDATVGDRATMAHAGSLVVRGRGRGVVTATGLATEVGRIARAATETEAGVPPLIARMAVFGRWVGIAVGVACAAIGFFAWARGMPATEVFFFAIALAVSAIPEGLPVALTIALAIATHRMSRRRVIVRRLAAVEALGSCTLIASDKTGTLTLNEMTARRVALPGEPAAWAVEGEGLAAGGRIALPEGTDAADAGRRLERLALAAALANEGSLVEREGALAASGDAVDTALLVLARKVGVSRPSAEARHPPLGELPFEAERMFAARLCAGEAGAPGAAPRPVAFVKGALERILPMCATMTAPEGDVPLDAAAVEAQAHALADGGHRILAFASGPVEGPPGAPLYEERLRGLVFLGLVGMIDPPRPEARRAVDACRGAGIEVAMVTGDHPRTAAAIARELGILRAGEEAATGARLAELRAGDPGAYSALVRRTRVFARVEPRQKLEIVEELQRAGHYLAVTGDGANDAPALRAANVGVAMGLRGTDVARESAEIVLTDDDFASIVAGVEEGRIAYGNVRKVVYLLISCGAAEIVIFILSLAAGLPMPLVAVQLLWLNLVTNGIQDVALAFEPGEGDELRRRPRPPEEPLMDRSMVEQCVISAAVMGVVSFLAFAWLLDHGRTLEAARNEVLLLYVLFENCHLGNVRSETRSAFAVSPFRNPYLVLGAVVAQALHIGAMHTPGLRDVLRIEPVSVAGWLGLLAVSTTVVLAMEAYKLVRGRTRAEPAPGGAAPGGAAAA